MNTVGFDVSPVIRRLRERVAPLKACGGAADLDRARSSLTTAPAAFVLPARDMPSASPFMDGVVSQEVPTEFAVVLAVKNVADATGAAALDALTPVRQAVGAALLGWLPEGAELSCEYAGGEMVDFVNGVLWWTDSYRTQYQIRSL